MNAHTYLTQVIPTLQTDRPDMDAQILLAHVLDCPRSRLIANLHAPLTPPQIESANHTFARLRTGEPLPYILGHWEFFGLDFDINSDVLIPRPETELLVEKAIQWLDIHPQKRSVADIGTGSGAIAIAIASRIPNARILATDISPAALEVARHNAAKFGLRAQVEFAECDLFPPAFPPNFDLICANLPYIPTQTLKGLPIFRREPTIALDGGEDGLTIIRRLLDLAPARLAPGGRILLEIEATQGSKARALAVEKFPQASIALHQDLAGHDRLLEISFDED
ncbi:MAG: Release factor glutamine methyltransferase [Anaerolineales bacterium]|nr:Release factor glutamine methyltransferase [Anaerolineales bacterium]